MKILKMCGSSFYNGYYEWGLFKGDKKLAGFGIVSHSTLIPKDPEVRHIGLIWWTKR